MNVAKIRALADYIEANKSTFFMGDSNRCIVGFGLRMDGKVGFYDADGGVLGFAERFDMPYQDANLLYSGYLHGNHSHNAGGTAAMLRELADKAEPPIKVIPIADKSEGPIAMTVAVRVTAPIRELVPA